MKKSHKIALATLTLSIITAGILGYNIFQKQTENDPYVARGNECTYINYVCGPGTTEFYDGIGCGCKAVEADPITPNKTNEGYYVGRGEACKYIEYVCESGREQFVDEIGCGCK